METGTWCDIQKRSLHRNDASNYYGTAIFLLTPPFAVYFTQTRILIDWCASAVKHTWSSGGSLFILAASGAWRLRAASNHFIGSDGNWMRKGNRSSMCVEHCFNKSRLSL